MNLKDMICQSDYFDLITTEKHFIDRDFNFPSKNQSITLDAEDEENNNYKVDINRKRAIITRCTYLERHPINNVLLRLDIDTKPHRNPHTSEVIGGNHIHIYTNDYGDSIAVELDDPILKIINPNFDINRFNIDIKNENRLYAYFEAFSDFCNIKNIPIYQFSLS